MWWVFFFFLVIEVVVKFNWYSLVIKSRGSPRNLVPQTLFHRATKYLTTCSLEAARSSRASTRLSLPPFLWRFPAQKSPCAQSIRHNSESSFPWSGRRNPYPLRLNYCPIAPGGCVNAWSLFVAAMYITTASSSASSLLRASRARFTSSLSSVSFSRTFSPPVPQVSPLTAQQRSLSFSAAVRSLRCSVPRWSHGVDWRSPLSLRAQSRVVSPVIERFQRKIATMGNDPCPVGLPDILEWSFHADSGEFPFVSAHRAF